MDICIVGAGVSGLATARMMDRIGHRPTVYDTTPDVGGVWSRVRRSRDDPNLQTQNPSSTYYLCEHPWPAGASAFPKGPEVTAYFASYVEKFDLEKRLRLSTEVVGAKQGADKRWTVTTRPTDPECGKRQTDAPTSEQTFDVLIVCNGVFCDGQVPAYEGVELHAEGGGHVGHSSAFLDLDAARGKDLIVVGYGKSACDVAMAVSSVAKSTTVIARKLIWKLPRHLNGILPYQYLLLNRLGEALFLFKKPGPVSRALHGPLLFVRNAMMGSLGWVVQRQLKLNDVGLLPTSEFETIARSQISLVSEGFYEAVREGKIKVKRDTMIISLVSEGGKLVAKLSDGDAIPADIILAGTGFNQKIPFLEPELVRHFTDENGNFLLYRQIEPLGVERLYCNGYNSSLFCPASSEAAAMWIASAISGTLTLPPVEERRREAEEMFAWLDKRSEGKHAKGTTWIPFSLACIDLLLQDLKTSLKWYDYLLQWVWPVRPKAYAAVADEVVRRIEAKRKGE